MNRLKWLASNIPAKNWVVFIILFFAGLIAYEPALDGKFLYDDSWLVGQNPFFKSPIFVLEVFKHYLFLDSFSVYYRPVQNITYMFDYWLWNHDSFGYHLSNVCYHALTGFLLFLLLKRLLPALVTQSELGEDDAGSCKRGDLLAFIVALVWVVHPIHNAAVAYVAGRADSVACVFAISAWLLSLRADRSTSPWVKCSLLCIAWMFCLLGLCSKEIAFIWMALFIFHLFVFSPQKSLRQKFATVAGIALVLGLYVILRRGPGGGAPVGGGDERVFSMRCMLMLRALGDYTWLIFYPNDLHMDRVVFSTNAYKSMAIWQAGIRFEYLSVIGALMIIAFILMGRSKLPGQRLRNFAIAWFFLGFLPISNLFPLNAQVAEHWIYMPSAGFLLFLAGSVLALPKRFHATVACVAIIAVIPLTIRTMYRSYDWADPERFYLQTIRAGGGSTRINLNLALVYQDKGDLVQAEKMMRDILTRFPDYMPAKLNLGVNLRRQKKDQEAEGVFKYDKAAADKMAKEYPHTQTAAENMAQLKFAGKDYEGSLGLLDDAIRRYPEEWELYQLKAQDFQYLGRMSDGIQIIQNYADAHWWHYGSFMTLARLRLVNGETDAALADFQHAALLDIHASDPYEKMAQVYLGTKRPEEAYKAEMKAIRREPDQPSLYIFLSAILDKLDRKAESDEAIKRAEELRDSVKDAFKRGS